MKPKKIQKRLNLNKSTITNLGDHAMRRANGGYPVNASDSCAPTCPITEDHTGCVGNCYTDTCDTCTCGGGGTVETQCDDFTCNLSLCNTCVPV